MIALDLAHGCCTTKRVQHRSLRAVHFVAPVPPRVDDPVHQAQLLTTATLAKLAESRLLTRELLLRWRRHVHEARALLASDAARTGRDVLPAISLGDFFAGCVEKPADPDSGAIAVADALRGIWLSRPWPDPCGDESARETPRRLTAR